MSAILLHGRERVVDVMQQATSSVAALTILAQVIDELGLHDAAGLPLNDKVIEQVDLVVRRIPHHRLTYVWAYLPSCSTPVGHPDTSPASGMIASATSI
ncbi:hypothetical protein [Methylobacterium oryzisoli]|uniref:hypothetical protein n=1 Tax=Methylobacterium oryzisoli TaxID=3385502 RepID=UPI003891F4CB